MTGQIVLASGSSIAGLIIALLLYFVPSVVAFVRHHHNQWAIFALNLLLGGPCWDGSARLVWSLTRPAAQPHTVHVIHEPGKAPPPPELPPESPTS